MPTSRAIRFSRRHIPKLTGVIIAGGQDTSTMDAECHREHSGPMLQRGARSFARGRIPKPGGIVQTSGEKLTPIGAKGQASDFALVSEDCPDRLAVSGIPKPGGVICASGGDRLAVRRIRCCPNCTLMARKAMQ